MNDPRVPEIFTISDEDKKRYGNSAIGNSLILARNLFQADAGTRFILASHGGWDHHGDIYKENTRNHPVLIRELDAAFSSLIKDLDGTPSKHTSGQDAARRDAGRCMSEFGRTPGPISETRKGREHYIHVHSGMFAGGGIKRGAVIGKTDEAGGKIVDSGWSGGRRSTWKTSPARSTPPSASTGPRRSKTRRPAGPSTTSSRRRARSTWASSRCRSFSPDT